MFFIFSESWAKTHKNPSPCGRVLSLPFTENAVLWGSWLSAAILVWTSYLEWDQGLAAYCCMGMKSYTLRLPTRRSWLLAFQVCKTSLGDFPCLSILSTKSLCFCKHNCHIMDLFFLYNLPFPGACGEIIFRLTLSAVCPEQRFWSPLTLFSGDRGPCRLLDHSWL